VFQGNVTFLITDERAAELEKSAESGAAGENKPIIIYTTTYYVGLDLGESEGLSALSDSAFTY